MKLAIVVLGLAITTPALAQTTICGDEFGKWVCRTQQQVPQPNIMKSYMDAFDRGQQQAQPARQQRDFAAAAERQSAQVASEEARAVNAKHVRELVGDQVAQGHCAYAKTIALQAGELDLAEQAIRICTPAP